ncbi:hypothetical protein D9M69_605920 [compost metagenome]
MRELRSVLRALVALADPGDAVTADALPAHLHDAAPVADFNEATLSQPNAPLLTGSTPPIALPAHMKESLRAPFLAFLQQEVARLQSKA